MVDANEAIVIEWAVVDTGAPGIDFLGSDEEAMYCAENEADARETLAQRLASGAKAWLERREVRYGAWEAAE